MVSNFYHGDHKLILKSVGDGSDLHRWYVVVDYNILILLWVENNLVCFLKNFCEHYCFSRFLINNNLMG